MDWPILSTIILIPLLGSLTILLINSEDEIGKRNIKIVALYTCIVNFLASIFLWVNFDKLSSEFQFIERYAWLAENITYHVGIDGISLFLIILTTFLMPFCILASWTNISNKIKDYMVAFLILESLMIGVFCALDLVVFYLFFLKPVLFLCSLLLVFGVALGVSMQHSNFSYIH